MNDEEIAKIARTSSGRLDMWVKTVAAMHAKRVLEVGVWKGDYSAELLRNCPNISTYLMIDPWRHIDQWNKPFNVNQKTFEDIYASAMETTAFAAQKRKVLRGTTIEVSKQIENSSIDFAYIDGDHTLRGIVVDLINIRGKVRPGGIIGGDDFSADIWQHTKDYEPTLVFPFAVHFAEANRLKIMALPYNQFAILIPEPAETPVFQFIDLTSKYKDTGLLGQMYGTKQEAIFWLKRNLPGSVKRALRQLRPR
ncbi:TETRATRICOPEPTIDE REPEAT FAMILY PROTEIN [Candidatus Phaeomarinobacter ectocarpi]|uniref:TETRATRICOPEPTIDE REPEAT FAMILY PROTEIN n=1 Tax=Candidatus Phaeomarinibacter ectocarpi TaxID=1458461 RepID=X5ML23_9HYPH|nr:class I SAM-dependent methyltransferase [Candidatus Phaeomarinobacter ectocarpi]CDO59090.1 TETRATRICOPEPTIDE REPEAT FAMILY PROTEIN [Candidatus Phaeomarinobacter ectocarpi]